MAWWEYVEFPVWIHAYVYHRISDAFGKDKPPRANAADIPKTDEGSSLPMVYGRCRVRQPALIWLGNWILVPRGSTAFAYKLDMLFVVGVPFYGGQATLHLIYAGDFQLNLQVTGPDSMDRPGRYTFQTTNAFEVYGGDQKGGGIIGNIEFFDGRRTQQLSDYINDFDPSNYTNLQTRLTLSKFSGAYDHPELINETLQPGYRNQAVCLLWDWEIGETPTFTSYSFEVRSLSAGTSAYMGQELTDEADPAAVIYDLLTSPWAKIGIPASRIDLTSFAAASLTLFGESHGYSRAIEEQADASEIIGDILKQIDGLLYEEPTTGKLVLKLIRLDYDVGGLDDVNPDNTEKPESGWYSVRGWSETFNQVRVTFTDRQNNYADGMKVAQNGANVYGQTSRALRSVDLHFVGCCTEALAKKLAARELAVVSRPLARATVTVNRSFYQKRPGDVVTLTWPELGINHMVMRIVRVDLGQLHDGKIRLELLQDVFGVTQGAF